MKMTDKQNNSYFHLILIILISCFSIICFSGKIFAEETAVFEDETAAFEDEGAVFEDDKLSLNIDSLILHSDKYKPPVYYEERQPRVGAKNKMLVFLPVIFLSFIYYIKTRLRKT